MELLRGRAEQISARTAALVNIKMTVIKKVDLLIY